MHCRVMTKADGVSGTDFLLTEDKGRGDIEAVALDLALALDEIHGNNVSHGDLKLDNFFIDGRRVKLIDFGFSVERAEGARRKDIKEWANAIYRLLTFGDEVTIRSRDGAPIEANERIQFRGHTVNEPHYHVDPECPEDPDCLGRIRELAACGNLDEVVLCVMTCPSQSVPAAGALANRLGQLIRG